ncbi:MAG: LytTR family DNA-binding domain-containing protein [bacterium]|nr:LytTR family transcriptional regulator [bacterium]MDD6225497.1 LytTR family DNA-binding domain-containing protein [bacterium]MDY3862197.1 LytTR family DNA-binding domain-containing protein [Ruminococcus sp.]
MKVEIKVDKSLTEPRVIIETNEITQEVSEIVKKLSEEKIGILTGFKQEQAEILEQSEIYCVYSSAKKVFAVTEKGEYALKFRMYELEEKLDKNCFVRISNSEIINLKKVKSFDLSLTGTICVKMKNGRVTYASRRYVSKIKQVLGI